MKWTAAVLLLAVAAAAPEIRYFRYERGLAAQAATRNGSAQAGAAQTCVALDATVFAHAAPGLADLRLYRTANAGEAETPYAMYEPQPVAAAAREIAVMNLGTVAGQTTFDARMPDGAYRDIVLDVQGENFIASVAVTGSQDQTSMATRLGSFTIFDLTNQKLGRSTVLHLPQSDFRYLHFMIVGPVKPQQVAGLTVERAARGQQAYVIVTETATVTQKDRESVVQFSVPAHVPVERIEFVPGPQPENFSRNVVVAVKMTASRETNEDELPEQVSTSGNLLRVHGVHDGHQIDEEHLAVDAPYADLNTASQWTVTIDNGDDAPLDLKAVRLEMAERTLCFDAAAGASYTLFYGDAALAAPRYDYATLFTPEKDAAQATLGPEQANPQYVARPDTRPFTERYPWLLWLALALVVALLGAVALRTAKESAPPR